MRIDDATVSDRARLAAGEQLFSIPGPLPGGRLFLRFLQASTQRDVAAKAVLYIHGATFPSGLSIAYRFGGRSWRDALCDEGFDVWALDFHGFGHSTPFPEMLEPAEAHGPLGTAGAAAEQIAAAVDFILHHAQIEKVSIIAHSWGTMPTGIFAGNHPERIDRLVFFAPITWREPASDLHPMPAAAWRLISLADQWTRFQEDLPPREQPVLTRAEFDAWGQDYLDSDPDSRVRQPPAVKVPSGPAVEIQRAWRGELAYDPGRIVAPVAIIRGAWDRSVTDTDARWLFDALTGCPILRGITIARGTHLLHLEQMRGTLWRESATFLRGEERTLQDSSPHPITSLHCE